MQDFFQYFITDFSNIMGFAGEHVMLTIITVGIALLIGVPLGISVYYYKKSSKIVLGVANIIQAIPSLALLGFMIPLLGIGKLPSIVVITLYSLLPIIKNTYIGISGIRPETIEAAVGMGLTKRQVLTKIQLPIALPIIMGGIRIAAVTAVGTVTIAAFIGGGGLGYLIFSGIRTVNNAQILAGAIPACILALIVDWLFGKIEDYLGKRHGTKKDNKSKKRFFIIVGVVIASVLGITGYNALNNKTDITIASKDFTEQIVLTHIFSDLIEDQTDLKVDRKPSLGGSSLVYDAAKAGSIDGYVDYLGTIYVSILKQAPTSDVSKVYNYSKKQLADKDNLFLGKDIGFNNTYTLSVTPETAKKYNLITMSDLKKHEKDLNIAATIEFFNRPDGLKGLNRHYGLSFNKQIAVDGSQRYTALQSGEADVIDAFLTDGLIKKFNLVTLEDDKKFFPPYQAVPVVRQETLDKYPELKGVLKSMENLISEEDMQKMNYLVDEKYEDPAKVAHDFLVKKGMIKEQ
ncbi:MAG: glycine betaine ABC transporter substrate-binding protein [Erysipelotrichales bacterium]